MELVLEDLPQHGLWLIGPSSPQYDQYLSEILHRREEGVGRGRVARAGRPIDESQRAGSAILVNGSGKDIAAVALMWRYERDGPFSSSRVVSQGMHGCPSLLLPFGLVEQDRESLYYWLTIMAGSKRYVGPGPLVGDNRDVHPAVPGGMMGEVAVGDHRGKHPPDWRELRSITLSLDGVFFADAEFVGPDRSGNWVRVTREAEVHRTTGRLVHEGLQSGDRPEDIFARVSAPDKDDLEPGAPPEQIYGPRITMAEQSPRSYTRRDEARMLSMYRQHFGDEKTIERLASWHGAVLPDFRRL
ncbi:hypothetical protein [uncultured Paludibaculum sp.]|uniref:hypothetical protein n=1 Tax=uncultured Paludibaculum sp. TaxID=1765020 RepID=UPI002AAB284D|nr:hypothetical protein [uncultured Paludibaculum sp.]